MINGVRCQPRRSKKATWDDLIEVGNAGWRGSDAVAPSFLVKVRVGQSQRDAVEQHNTNRAAGFTLRNEKKCLPGFQLEKLKSS